MIPIRQGNTRVEAQLQQLISPFILRRSKSEVAPELPPLTEETIYCDMPEEQNTLYEQEKIVCGISCSNILKIWINFILSVS